ncbi:hypothetical protein [Anabaena sp. FACHB-1237]|uniref:hypothetical protein n=1 Tax=Anabaena sp. FACHB-1237 TaxID=2692769 RepID=UPI001F549D00|nr:hypothetical protein [Anabaena sp. FACHB-1237]
MINSFVKSFIKKNLPPILAVVLIMLTACSSIALLPTPELIEKAIAIQLQQTQEELNQKLDLHFQKLQLQHLYIMQQQPLTIENLPAYRVTGSYDINARLAKHRFTQLQKPFDIYLQIQKEGKSWRLLIPEKSDKNTQNTPSKWQSYLIL